MISLVKRNKIYLLLVLLTMAGVFLRFYNLNWGAPFYFHPDERNIVYAITQLEYPRQMNPHFFAYGSLPIYIIYFTGLLLNKFKTAGISFEQAILISRFYSAFFSVLLIPITFFLGKKLRNTSTGIVAAVLTTFSVGYIQFAHFGTFEMWLTFFSILLFGICLDMLHTITIKKMFLAAIVFGVLISTKISSIVLVIIPIGCIVYKEYFTASKTFRNLLAAKADIILFLLYAGLVYLITNPFIIIDYHSFLNSIRYESAVALGKLPVFYTGEFKQTTPILYQLLKVYPFLLNPFITILFIPTFLLFCFDAIKRKKLTHIIIIAFIFLLVVSQAFLYVKWTRYMVPTLPFIYLIIATFITPHKTNHKYLIHSPFILFGAGTVILCALLFSTAYFITVFTKPDTRIMAAEWAKKNIPSQEIILSEMYDLGIIPFNQNFPYITLFNFYDLDNSSPEYNNQTLRESVRSSNYLIFPSQRVLKVRLRNSAEFPNGHLFYTMVYANQMGFTKIYETPCDIWCTITYLRNPIYAFEGTANVFDRPTVSIFKRL